MIKIKIIGAGSIGNHLAQAARRMGWDVTVVDRDSEALRRMREEIYPKRYGAWDEAIRLFTSAEEPKGGFDIIAIGTPPDVHMKLALAALDERPKVLQIEKPLCTPSLEGLKEFEQKLRMLPSTAVVVGYDHAVGASVGEVIRLLREGIIGNVETVDVEFREHWQGIFGAHPWLKGPKDTYLGFWNRGGGAAGEHSHALHLWHLFAGVAGLGRPTKVGTMMEIKKTDGAEYDSVASFSLITDQGKVGRVVQDVVTFPTKKWAKIQGIDGFVEWIGNGHPKGDIVRWGKRGGETSEKVFEKTRPDDFHREMLHIANILTGKIKAESSPLSLGSATQVMRVVATAHAHRGEFAAIV